MKGVQYEGQNLTRLWEEVAFGELAVLTQLAALAFIMQYSVFFFLMFSQSGIRDFSAPYCQSLFFISDKLASDKGTSSVMVISGIVSWVVLGVISSRNGLLLNRGITAYLAVVGYTGTVAVVLFDNTSNHGDVHLIGAGLLAVTYIFAQLNYSYHTVRHGSISAFTKYATLGLSLLCSTFGVIFAIVYGIESESSQPCISNAVILEYVVYLLVALNNIVIYADFTAAHAYLKLARHQQVGEIVYPKLLPKDEDDIPRGQPVDPYEKEDKETPPPPYAEVDPGSYNVQDGRMPARGVHYR